MNLRICKIDILYSKGGSFMKNTGRKFESYVKHIYTRLLELNDYDDIAVSTNVTIKGISGATNEFDIFYQFQHLNIECKVVIECKDWKTNVSIAEVRDFVSKIKDIGMGQVIGIMISKKGYQDGAKKYAEANGIKLLREDDLPTIPQLLSGVIQKGFLPTEKCIGEPFWTIMECIDGKVTGTYMSMPKSLEEAPIIPLFFKPSIAELVLKQYIDSNRYCVRGVTQYQLKRLLALKQFVNLRFALFCLPLEGNKEEKINYVIFNADEIAEVYLRK